MHSGFLKVGRLYVVMYQYRPADTDVWVQTHTHTHSHIRKEREVCSFSWLRAAAAENSPSSPPLPAPTSCLHYSRVFEATPVTARSKAGEVKADWSTVSRFFRPSPSVADRWYGLPRSARSHAVCARCR